MRKNLGKLPWHGYLNIQKFRDFKMPQIRARSHKSKLYHEKMVREIFLQSINDLPIEVEYGHY